jgi:rubrerythrin
MEAKLLFPHSGIERSQWSRGKEMEKQNKERIKALEEMIQVVLLAIPRENSACEFYLNAAEKAVTDSSREMSHTLADQEKGHEAELKKILDELKSELGKLKKG